MPSTQTLTLCLASPQNSHNVTTIDTVREKRYTNKLCVAFLKVQNDRRKWFLISSAGHISIRKSLPWCYQGVCLTAVGRDSHRAGRSRLTVILVYAPTCLFKTSLNQTSMSFISITLGESYTFLTVRPGFSKEGITAQGCFFGVPSHWTYTPVGFHWHSSDMIDIHISLRWEETRGPL